jgi:hypothetical protein
MMANGDGTWKIMTNRTKKELQKLNQHNMAVQPMDA